MWQFCFGEHDDERCREQAGNSDISWDGVAQKGIPMAEYPCVRAGLGRRDKVGGAKEEVERSGNM